MSGSWDATILVVHAAEDRGTVPVDAVRNGDAFDVLASVRIGRNLMQFVDACRLFVSVRNLSQSTVLVRQQQSFVLTPRNAPLDQVLQLKVPAGWTASEGDALEVVATFKVTAGANHDYTMARSAPFVVTS